MDGTEAVDFVAVIFSHDLMLDKHEVAVTLEVEMLPFCMKVKDSTSCVMLVIYR